MAGKLDLRGENLFKLPGSRSAVAPNANVNENVSNNESIDADDSTNISADVGKNVSADKSVDVDDDVITIVSADIYANEVTNRNANVFVINKAPKEEAPIRTTYWLKPSTIKKIAKLAKQADKKISPFLQEFLDGVLDKIEIK